MRNKLGVDTYFWGFSSAIWLLFCVLFWWIVPIKEPPVGENLLFLQPMQPEIKFQETEIVHLGETGKEWSLKARLISQKGMEIEMEDIAGCFFFEGEPLYSLAASRGKVSLESGDALFWEVSMQEVSGERLLSGKLLQWIAREKRCILEEANFKDRKANISGGEIVYQLEKGKLYVSGDVVVNVRLDK